MSAYKVAIELTMSNGVSGVLSKLAHEFLGIHTKAREVEKSLAAWKGLIAGAGATFVGGKMLKGLDEALNKSRELYNLHIGMQQRGFDQAPALFDAKARELSNKYRNLNRTELEHVMSDVLPIFTSPEKTAAEFEPIARLMSVLKAKYGAEGSQGYLREAVAALKSAEAAGYTKPEDLDHHLLELLKMRFQFGDLVPISSYLTAQRNMGANYRNTDEAFRYGVMPALIESEGQRAGTMMNTLLNKWTVGIRNSSASLQLLQQLDLAKAEDLDFNSKGQPVGVKAGHDLAMGRLAGKNPLDAFEQVVLPAIIKKFGDDPHTLQQVAGQITKDQNAQRAVAEFMANSARLYRDAKLQGLVKDDFSGYLDHSYEYAHQSVIAQKENLETAAGMAAMPQATQGLNLFAGALNAVSDAAQKYPTLTTVATGLYTLAGGLLTVAGPLAMTLALLRIKGYAKTAADAAKGGGAAAAEGAADASASATAGAVEGAAAATGRSLIGKLGAGLKSGLVLGALEFLGERAIDLGLSALPKPKMPDGYDPQKEREKGLVDRLKDIYHDVFPATEAATKQIGTNFSTDVGKLPGMVDPSINAAISAIGAKLSAAISSLSAIGAGAAQSPPKPAVIEHHSSIMMDKQKMASSITRQMVRTGYFPTSTGGTDNHGYWSSPGTTLADIA